MTLTVSAQAVRDYLELNSPGSTSKYSDATIGSNILAAQSAIEQATNRYFVDRTFTAGAPWVTTSFTQMYVPIPGFRSFTSIVQGGVALVVDQSVWPIPDPLQTGVYLRLQFRPPLISGGMPGFLAYSDWFDVGRDLPWYPPNMGRGFIFNSMPNDLAIAGSAGYAAGTEPYQFLHAVKVLAAFYTMRPASILADVAITPAGGVLNYSQMPAEVRDFIAAWSCPRMAVSV